MSIGSPKSPGPSVILGVVSGLTRTAAEVGRPETQVTHTISILTSFDAHHSTLIKTHHSTLTLFRKE